MNTAILEEMGWKIFTPRFTAKGDFLFFLDEYTFIMKLGRNPADEMSQLSVR